MRKLKILFSLAAAALILNGATLPVQGEDRSNAPNETSSDASAPGSRSADAPPLEIRKSSHKILTAKSEEDANKAADEVLAVLKSHREVEGAKEADLEQIRTMKLDMLKAPNPSEEQRKTLMKTIATFDNAILAANKK